MSLKEPDVRRRQEPHTLISSSLFQALTTVQAEIEEMIPDYRELVKLCQ